jgi:hypothetical protein
MINFDKKPETYYYRDQQYCTRRNGDTGSLECEAGELPSQLDTADLSAAASAADNISSVSPQEEETNILLGMGSQFQ